MKTSKKIETATEVPKVRIVYRGECSKLTARGKGSLSYELGVESKEQLIRVSGNLQGGTFSFEWISLRSIGTLLENPDPKNPAFTAVVFKKVFVGRSANNHGYLAAIMREENVIAHDPQQASQLTYLSFKEIKAKIKSLQDIDLPNHIAASLKLREEKKAQRKAAATRKAKPVPNKKKVSK